MVRALVARYGHDSVGVLGIETRGSGGRGARRMRADQTGAPADGIGRGGGHGPRACSALRDG